MESSDSKEFERRGFYFCLIGPAAEKAMFMFFLPRRPSPDALCLLRIAGFMPSLNWTTFKSFEEVF